MLYNPDSRCIVIQIIFINASLWSPEGGLKVITSCASMKRPSRAALRSDGPDVRRKGTQTKDKQGHENMETVKVKLCTRLLNNEHWLPLLSFYFDVFPMGSIMCQCLVLSKSCNSALTLSRLTFEASCLAKEDCSPQTLLTYCIKKNGISCFSLQCPKNIKMPKLLFIISISLFLSHFFTNKNRKAAEEGWN